MLFCNQKIEKRHGNFPDAKKMSLAYVKILPNKLIGKQNEVLLYEPNGLKYLIQIYQMSHDFLLSEICFISNKREFSRFYDRQLPAVYRWSSR